MSNKENKKKDEKKKEISWRAAEYEYHKKGSGWYFSVIGIAAAIFIFALSQKNFFFAMFVVVAAIMVVSFGKRRPRVLDFKIDEEGIHVDKDTSYSYDNLEWFAIDSRSKSLSQIIIKKDSKISPLIKMRADSNVVEKAKNILKEKIEENEDYEESLIDSLAEFLGF